MENGNPEFLYHYTNIENLALILKNRTIRFNNLINLDDLEEGHSLEVENPGKLTFASCWTDSSEEHIPLWYMYSKRMEGVRIKLPTNPFSSEPKFSGNNIFNIDHNQPLFIKLEKPDQYVIQLRKKFIGYAVLHVNNDLKIIYTDEDAEIKPILFTESNDKKWNTITRLGRFKRLCWKFQEECRYIISVIPEIDFNTSSGKENLELWKEAYLNVNSLAFDDLFLFISRDSFEQMEVMTGPGANEGHKTIVHNLIEKYNPEAKVIESALAGKIRF